MRVFRIAKDKPLHTMKPGARFSSYIFVLRGTGPRNTGCGVRFFCRAGAVSRDCSLILAILINPGHPASDAIDIKVLSDLFSVLLLRAIDIQVRWTCSRMLVAAVARGPVPRMRSAV